MSIAVLLKNNLKNIPPSLGVLINRIPYGKRPGIGRVYTQRRNEIELLDAEDTFQQQSFVFNRLKEIVDFSYENIKFYKDYYNTNNFHPSQLKSFEDIDKIPITSKSILNAYSLEDRSYPTDGRYLVNTGGSSGTPFGFYIEPDSMGHEWAHMHTIWSNLGYKHTDLKLVFGGRSDLKKVVEYDVVRNHFAVDIYADYKLVAQELKKWVKKYKIKYLHGYPSSIYDFAVYCEKEDPELRRLLSANLEGAFLGSEYPHKLYRDVIENVFDIQTISWYGHTERAVLAYEKNDKFTYEPFLSYGFAEALKNENGEDQLIATSYYNHASPLIRYNTEDIISNVKIKEGILESFKITKGREGEFVIDQTGKKINLTGLIFGRHHELFNMAQFIQVKQVQKGKIEIHFVSDIIQESEARKLFDNKNLAFEISFKKRNKPARTGSGKINLLIK